MPILQCHSLQASVAHAEMASSHVLQFLHGVVSLGHTGGHTIVWRQENIAYTDRMGSAALVALSLIHI